MVLAAGTGVEQFVGQCLADGPLRRIQKAVGQFNVVCSVPKGAAAKSGECPGVDVHVGDDLSRDRDAQSMCLLLYLEQEPVKWMQKIPSFWSMIPCASVKQKWVEGSFFYTEVE